MALLLAVLVFLAYRARRWLVGIVAKASTASLGASTDDSSTTGLPLHRPAPSHPYEALDAGPSSSAGGHRDDEMDDELVDEIALRISQNMKNPSSTGVVGPLDEEVLDRIAHRVANIVQGDAPPSYSASTS